MEKDIYDVLMSLANLSHIGIQVDGVRGLCRDYAIAWGMDVWVTEAQHVGETQNSHLSLTVFAYDDMSGVGVIIWDIYIWRTGDSGFK